MDGSDDMATAAKYTGAKADDSRWSKRDGPTDREHGSGGEHKAKANRKSKRERERGRQAHVCLASRKQPGFPAYTVGGKRPCASQCVSLVGSSLASQRVGCSAAQCRVPPLGCPFDDGTPVPRTVPRSTRASLALPVRTAKETEGLTGLLLQTRFPSTSNHTTRMQPWPIRDAVLRIGWCLSVCLSFCLFVCRSVCVGRHPPSVLVDALCALRASSRWKKKHAGARYNTGGATAEESCSAEGGRHSCLLERLTVCLPVSHRPRERPIHAAQRQYPSASAYTVGAPPRPPRRCRKTLITVPRHHAALAVNLRMGLLCLFCNVKGWWPITCTHRKITRENHRAGVRL